MQQPEFMVPKQYFEKRITRRIPGREDWESGSVMNKEDIADFTDGSLTKMGQELMFSQRC